MNHIYQNSNQLEADEILICHIRHLFTALKKSLTPEPLGYCLYYSGTADKDTAVSVTTTGCSQVKDMPSMPKVQS